MFILLSFIATSKAVEFQCGVFRNDIGWPSVGTTYTCWFGQVAVKNSSTSLESVQGKHLEGRKNADVKAISIYNDRTKMEKLPGSIEKFFPKLLVFRWIFGNIKSISSQDLKPFPRLKVLILGENKITSLDGNLFKNNLQLRRIEFWSNKISIVGKNLLGNLKDLTYADFRFNPCIKTWAETPKEIDDLKQELLDKCPL